MSSNGIGGMICWVSVTYTLYYIIFLANVKALSITDPDYHCSPLISFTLKVIWISLRLKDI